MTEGACLRNMTWSELSIVYNTTCCTADHPNARPVFSCTQHLRMGERCLLVRGSWMRLKTNVAGEFIENRLHIILCKIMPSLLC